MKKGLITFFYSVSQVHAGKGSDVGVVDLPIQREVHTGFPVISGIKGALRNEFDWAKNEIEIFGASPNKDSSDDSAGNIAISEAKIFLFPIRSLDKGFVWITCPMVLARIKSAAAMIGKKDLEEKTKEVLKEFDDKIALSTFNTEKEIYVEEYTVETKYSQKLKELFEKISELAPEEYLQDKMKKNILMISDEDFSFFVKNATEVNARITIDKKSGSTKEGSLRYEEFLPQDTVMYSVFKPLNNKDVMKSVSEEINKKYFNIGGKASIGKGIVYTYIIEGDN